MSTIQDTSFTDLGTAHYTERLECAWDAVPSDLPNNLIPADAVPPAVDYPAVDEVPVELAQPGSPLSKLSREDYVKQCADEKIRVATEKERIKLEAKARRAEMDAREEQALIEEKREQARQSRVATIELAKMALDAARPELDRLTRELYKEYLRVSCGKPSEWVRLKSDGRVENVRVQEIQADIDLRSLRLFSVPNEMQATKVAEEVERYLKGRHQNYIKEMVNVLEKNYRVEEVVRRPFQAPGKLESDQYNAFAFSRLAKPRPVTADGQLCLDMFRAILGGMEFERFMDVVAVFVGSLGAPGRQMPIFVIVGGPVANANTGKTSILECLRGIVGATEHIPVGRSANADGILKGNQFIGGAFEVPLLGADDPTDTASRRKIAKVFKNFASSKLFSAESKNVNNVDVNWNGLFAAVLNWLDALTILSASQGKDGTEKKRIVLVTQTPSGLFTRPEYKAKRNNRGDLLGWVRRMAPEVLAYAIQTRYTNMDGSAVDLAKWDWVETPKSLSMNLKYPDPEERFACEPWENPLVTDALRKGSINGDLSSFVHQIAPFLEDAKSDRGFCSSEILGQVQSWASIRIDSRTTAGAIDPRDVQRKRIGAGARMISAKALTKTLESLWASGQPGISRYPLAGYGAGNRVWWKLDPVELGKTDMPEDGK